MKFAKKLLVNGGGNSTHAVVASDGLIELRDLIRGHQMPDVSEPLLLTMLANPKIWDSQQQAYGELNSALAGLEIGNGSNVDMSMLNAPISPHSFRDFYAFEDHVRNARSNRGLQMIEEWYDAPVFYFSNTSNIIGPGAEVTKPRETSKLDYELELGAVIGMGGRDFTPENADSHIAGFTIINDWSMRDIQRREMKVGLGPCKSKDFATSIGPYLVTPDELEDRVIDRSRGKRYDLTMTASVNGVEYSRGNAKDMHWTFAELIAEASRNTHLMPGDLIGSGTVGTGCITEFPEGTHPWLQPGDVVRLEIDKLGVLENKII